MLRPEQEWCQQGRCTLNVCRVKQTPPMPVGFMVVGLHAFLDPKTCVENRRVHRMPKLSGIEE